MQVWQIPEMKKYIIGDRRELFRPMKTNPHHLAELAAPCAFLRPVRPLLVRRWLNTTCRGDFPVVNDLTSVVLYPEDGLLLGGDTFVFEHNSAVTATNLRVLLGLSYYNLGDYDEARSVVDFLDPGNQLDEGASSYLQDLLLALEALGVAYQ